MLYGLSSTVLTFLTICLTAFAVVIFDSIAFPIIVLVAKVVVYYLTYHLILLCL
ncbi:hypothetical protein VARV_NIG69_001_184.7 [Variola virus]|uniref:Uncharacterized protein n=1 Tax=Variola virus TaxID=10255 RepID=Q0NCZ5_VARV|nr:hypothetical protein VARV_NIG69_001_184.7 [Variola virus]